MADLPKGLNPLSHALSRLLRHEAGLVAGLKFDHLGWCRFKKLAGLNNLRKWTEDDIRTVVCTSLSNGHPRFELKEERGELWIRATQKHTINLGSLSLQHKVQKTAFASAPSLSSKPPRSHALTSKDDNRERVVDKPVSRFACKTSFSSLETAIDETADVISPQSGITLSELWGLLAGMCRDRPVTRTQVEEQYAEWTGISLNETAASLGHSVSSLLATVPDCLLVPDDDGSEEILFCQSTMAHTATASRSSLQDLVPLPTHTENKTLTRPWTCRRVLSDWDSSQMGVGYMSLKRGDRLWDCGEVEDGWARGEIRLQDGTAIRHGWYPPGFVSANHVLKVAILNWDGNGYGSDYLSLTNGSELWDTGEISEEWAKGEVVDLEGSTIATGWYPPSFVVDVVDQTKYDSEQPCDCQHELQSDREQCLEDNIRDALVRHAASGTHTDCVSAPETVASATHENNKSKDDVVPSARRGRSVDQKKAAAQRRKQRRHQRREEAANLAKEKEVANTNEDGDDMENRKDASDVSSKDLEISRLQAEIARLQHELKDRLELPKAISCKDILKKLADPKVAKADRKDKQRTETFEIGTDRNVVNNDDEFALSRKDILKKLANPKVAKADRKDKQRTEAFETGIDRNVTNNDDDLAMSLQLDEILRAQCLTKPKTPSDSEGLPLASSDSEGHCCIESVDIVASSDSEGDTIGAHSVTDLRQRSLQLEAALARLANPMAAERRGGAGVSVETALQMQQRAIADTERGVIEEVLARQSHSGPAGMFTRAKSARPDQLKKYRKYLEHQDSPEACNISSRTNASSDSKTNPKVGDWVKVIRTLGSQAAKWRLQEGQVVGIASVFGKNTCTVSFADGSAGQGRYTFDATDLEVTQARDS